MGNIMVLVILSIVGLFFLIYSTWRRRKSSSDIKYNHLIFKSAEGETAYIEAYNKSMSLWTTPYEINFVKTRFGDTFVIKCGRNDGEPLLLISGLAESSAYWFGNVTDLSKKYKIFAIDKIADLGKSITEKYPKNIGDFSDWLIDVMNALSIKKANIAGHSYGAWITLGFAIKNPERLNRVVLLSPAGLFCKNSGSFMWRGFKATVFPSRNNIENFHKWLHIKEELISEQGIIGWKNWRHKMIIPTVFSDTELKQLNIPVLFMIGSEDLTTSYTPNEIINKAKSLLKNFKGEIISNTGHNFPLEQSRIVNKYILDFLE